MAPAVLLPHSSADAELNVETGVVKLPQGCLAAKGPVKLVYCKEYRYYKNALNEERRIKKMRKENKQELIGNYENNKAK